MVRTAISRAFLIVALTCYIQAKANPINNGQSKEDAVDYQYQLDIEDDEVVKTRVKRRARIMYDYDDEEDKHDENDKGKDTMNNKDTSDTEKKGKPTVVDRAIKSIFFFGPRTFLKGCKKVVDFAEGGLLTISNSLRHTFTNLINSMS